MNDTWTIFNKGRASDTSIPYARKSDNILSSVPFNVKKTVSSMVPEDNEYIRYYYIERLIQVVMQSPFSSNLKALDPLNTYDRSIDQAPKVTIDNNTNLSITHNSHKTDTAIPVVNYIITLNVPEEKISVSSEYGQTSYALNMVSGLSDMIDISPSFSIRFQGDISTELNGSIINIVDTTHPAFDVHSVLTSAIIPEWYDSDMHKAYLNGTTIERLSAVVVNAVEGTINGS